MKILCVFGQHNYGDPSRGEGYEYTNFLPALQRLGHEVALFDSFRRDLYSDFADLNRRLLEKVQRFQPDILFCVLMGYEVWLETLDIIRSTGTTLINWGTDDSWKYEQFSRYVAPMFDLYATTYESAVKKSIGDGLDNFFLTQWAADSSRMRPPLPANQCRYDVSFVGSAYGNRKQWVETLERRGIRVAAFGHGWPNGPVNASEIASIMRESFVSLNFADSGILMDGGRLVRSRQIKARVFEVPGAGGMLLTEKADHLDDYYVLGEEIVVFEDSNDLLQKLEFLLAHPDQRDLIAQAGYERTKREHTYEARFKPLLSKALERRRAAGRSNYCMNMERFESIAQEHRHGLLLRLLGRCLAYTCRFVWGKDRGPRAARRLLFELSWRLAGRKTYSASGWPGRLFYRES